MRKFEKLLCEYCNKQIGLISEFDMNGTFISCVDCKKEGDGLQC